MKTIITYLWNKITLFLLLLSFVGLSIFFHNGWVRTQRKFENYNINYQRQIEFLDDQILTLNKEIDSLQSIPKTNDKEILVKYKNKYNIIVLNDDSISNFLRTELSKKSNN